MVNATPGLSYGDLINKLVLSKNLSVFTVIFIVIALSELAKDGVSYEQTLADVSVYFNVIIKFFIIVIVVNQ